MEYIKANKAMKILGIKSYLTLYKFIDKGLKCYGEKGSRRFKESDIIEFMEGK